MDASWSQNFAAYPHWITDSYWFIVVALVFLLAAILVPPSSLALWIAGVLQHDRTGLFVDGLAFDVFEFCSSSSMDVHSAVGDRRMLAGILESILFKCFLVRM